MNFMSPEPRVPPASAIAHHLIRAWALGEPRTAQDTQHAGTQAPVVEAVAAAAVPADEAERVGSAKL
jgi:hypothetical protein